MMAGKAQKQEGALGTDFDEDVEVRSTLFEIARRQCRKRKGRKLSTGLGRCMAFQGSRFREFRWKVVEIFLIVSLSFGANLAEEGCYYHWIPF